MPSFSGIRLVAFRFRRKRDASGCVCLVLGGIGPRADFKRRSKRNARACLLDDVGELVREQTMCLRGSPEKYSFRPKTRSRPTVYAFAFNASADAAARESV